MARKKFIRRLAPLPARPFFKSIENENRSARLLEVLRKNALQNQREEPQIFYSVRDVARHFSLPLSTVGRVYGRLKEEGILVGVPGSKTLLQGRRSGRHLSVLGVVGIPASVTSFVTVQDYRMFFIRTRRELRARGFAVATIFFNQGDIRTGRLISRIKKYNIDTLLWYQPKQGAKEITAHLKHAGVGIVGISDSGLAGIRCRYEVQRELAIREILRDWLSQHEIKSVIVIRTTKAAGAMEETLQTLLEEEGLAFEFKTVGHHRLHDFLEVLSRNKRAGVIFPSLAASFFAFRVPDGLTKLMSQARVALTEGPVSLAFVQVPDVHVDLVVVDWQLVAEQIVTDLVSKKAFDSDKVSVFEAQAHLRAPLSHYAESL